MIVPPSSDEDANDLDLGQTIAGAIEIFISDLRLAPRTKRTYWHALAKFQRHLRTNEGIDPAVAPVTILGPDHVTSFAAMLVPADIRTPEEVSQMRTAQNNLAALRKFCAYLASYDLNNDLAGDRIKTRLAAMMPRFCDWVIWSGSSLTCRRRLAKKSRQQSCGGAR
jgi:hypothetical protein